MLGPYFIRASVCTILISEKVKNETSEGYETNSWGTTYLESNRITKVS